MAVGKKVWGERASHLFYYGRRSVNGVAIRNKAERNTYEKQNMAL